MKMLDINYSHFKFTSQIFFKLSKGIMDSELEMNENKNITIEIHFELIKSKQKI